MATTYIYYVAYNLRILEMVFYPFHMKYLEVSQDRELDAILPAYLTYSALMHGVRTCEEKVASCDESLGTVALEFFNLAARYSRELHKN